MLEQVFERLRPTVTAGYFRCDAKDIMKAIVRSGVLLGMKHVASVMARHKKGSIINLSSMGGNVGSEGHGIWRQKGAVRTMTKDVVIEYAKKSMRVNSICPAISARLAILPWWPGTESTANTRIFSPVGVVTKGGT